MRKRRCRRYRRCDWSTVFAAAFGLGLFFALFCSVRFALLMAAIALIVFALSRRP